MGNSKSKSAATPLGPLRQGEHFVRRGNTYKLDDPALPVHLKHAVFAAGCFWGTEKSFWRLPGVYSTAVCYINGSKPDPKYREVCGGNTGHAEGTLVLYDPNQISLVDLLRNFWACHDPTQGNRRPQFTKEHGDEVDLHHVQAYTMTYKPKKTSPAASPV
jgi:methionine-S-sulfoxide reductase